MTTLLERVRAWSYRRQHLDRSESDLEPVLHELVGIYASQPTTILTLAPRLAHVDPTELRSLELGRRVVRIPGMRGSAHLVPTDLAPRVLAATARPRAQFAWIWRQLGLDDAGYEALGRQVVEQAREPISVRDLTPRLTGLPSHPQAVTMLVRGLRTEGRLIGIAPESVRSNAFSYVATEAWLGAPFAPEDPDSSLAWLAGAYLRTYGPARVEDVRWWSGATAARARAALAAHATVDVGDGRLLLAEDADAFASAEPLDPCELAVTPLWDMWTMGYAPDGRRRIVDEPVHERLYGVGDGLGTVLVAGRAVAAWGIRVSGQTAEVDLDAFEPVDGDRRRRVEARFVELTTLIGARDVRILEQAPTVRASAIRAAQRDARRQGGRLGGHGDDREE